ncbi:synaptotagmin-14-like [Dendronephthya gigantea]|uniref:synaptotagmin-14-like n=1 Tax=Dendronephthya gigantea TaxID=151771 RepID=UPI00106C820D|nr:synaptotagmin-14-like [Dendronephthya gigantea]
MKYDIVAPVVFLAVVFCVVIALAVIYRAVVKQTCSCLSDPGGREKERQKRKKEKGYDKVLTSEDSADEDIFIPPTLIVESEINPEFDQVVQADTHSPYSAFSAYGDTVSLDQTYVTERGLGRLRLEVVYYSGESRLKVHVIEGDGLPSKEQGGAANFKVHLTLLPKREQRFKSKTKSRYSPKFDETFEFKDVHQKELFTMAVRFRLYGVIATGNRLVGETFLQLADIANLDNQIIQDTWRAFRPLKKQTTKK